MAEAEKSTNFLSSLPSEKWWGDDFLYQLNGFWLMSQMIEPVQRVINHYRPLSNDVILASFPKTGTTWLKSLLYCITNPSKKDSLGTIHPNNLIPWLEIQVYRSPSPSSSIPATNPNNQMPRIFATHISYHLLEEVVNSSDCRVVYITRNPKDMLLSLWHFINKWKKAEDQPWPIEEAIEKFCNGVIPSGPYYDHVLGYWKQSLEKPHKVFFITYEELKNDAKTHVKRLAEFLGCRFDKEEEEVEEIVRTCSFEVLSNYEVNKSNDSPTWFEVPYSSFFRKGEVGDYRTQFTSEVIERIDALTKDKFHGSGFIYGV